MLHRSTHVASDKMHLELFSKKSRKINSVFLRGKWANMESLGALREHVDRLH